MCLAIPAKVLSIEGDQVRVDYGGVIKTVNGSLIERIEEGDFILIHAGFAIERLDPQAAKESLEIIMRDVAQFKDEDFSLKDQDVLGVRR